MTEKTRRPYFAAALRDEVQGLAERIGELVKVVTALQTTVTNLRNHVEAEASQKGQAWGMLSKTIYELKEVGQALERRGRPKEDHEREQRMLDVIAAATGLRKAK